MDLWDRVKASGAGEPGFYFTFDKDWGTNPCCEIALRPYQFCNLTEVNVSNVDTQEEYEARVKAAAQATDIGDASNLIAADVTTPEPAPTPSLAEPEPVLEDPPAQSVQVLIPKENVNVKDFDEWEGHFDNEWSGGASVYEGDNAPPEPEEKFDDLAWDTNAQPVKTIPKLPTK